jgi:hypothetical protein
VCFSCHLLLSQLLISQLLLNQLLLSHVGPARAHLFRPLGKICIKVCSAVQQTNGQTYSMTGYAQWVGAVCPWQLCCLLLMSRRPRR